MQEATLNPTLTSEPAEGLEAAALRAQHWYGEPFLHPDEEPAVALAPGTARRSALDEALVEMEAGLRAPSNRSDTMPASTPAWRIVPASDLSRHSRRI